VDNYVALRHIAADGLACEELVRKVFSNYGFDESPNAPTCSQQLLSEMVNERGWQGTPAELLSCLRNGSECWDVEELLVISALFAQPTSITAAPREKKQAEDGKQARRDIAADVPVPTPFTQEFPGWTPKDAAELRDLLPCLKSGAIQITPPTSPLPWLRLGQAYTHFKVMVVGAAKGFTTTYDMLPSSPTHPCWKLQVTQQLESKVRLLLPLWPRCFLIVV
jgi:hypothetical protein